jgi:chromosome segregation ATPase
VLLLSLPGCVPSSDDDVNAGDSPDLVRECSDLKRQNRDLSRQVQELEAEKQVLEGTIGDLRRRERLLSNRLYRMQEDLEKQKEIVEVLNKLPAERDAYKRKAESLEARVAELELELRNLRKETDEPVTGE